MKGVKSSRERLSVTEKVAYGFGDMASNFYWKLQEYFLLFFYTDVFGNSPKATGTMVLITRIWDAINDPFIGYLSDRTRTSWGRFRPYLLWMSVPLAITGTLVFYVPDLGPTGKLVYAYATYTLMMLAYSAINIPYGALMGVISEDSLERTSVATYRFVFAFLGGVIVQYFTLRLVDFFGSIGSIAVGNSRAEIDQASGFFWTVALFSVIATLMFLITFAVTRERVDQDQEQDSSFEADWYFVRTSWKLHQLALVGVASVALMATALDADAVFWIAGLYVALSIVSFAVSTATKTFCVHSGAKSVLRDDVDHLLRNRPWIVLCVFGLFHLAGSALRGGTLIFYFKYFVGDDGPIAAFLTAGTISGVVGMLFTRKLTGLLGKKRLMIFIKLFTTACLLVFFFLQPDQVALMFVVQIANGLIGGPLSAVLWAMYADVADYSQWKHGRRTTGLVFAAASFSQKLGAAVGVAMTGFLLAGILYVPPVDGVDQQQAEFTVQGLRWMFSLIPLVFSVVAVGVLALYPIDESLLKRIEQDLQGRKVD
ncbi:MAG: MFS transporter [Rhodopirellula sp. JB044]|uniref:MFS transporter n=1 Tax=Rhodopirellula sp. JB044 TaxID=3342844 RepID=UPI00370C4F2E